MASWHWYQVSILHQLTQTSTTSHKHYFTTNSRERNVLMILNQKRSLHTLVPPSFLCCLLFHFMKIMKSDNHTNTHTPHTHTHCMHTHIHHIHTAHTHIHAACTHIAHTHTHHACTHTTHPFTDHLAVENLFVEPLWEKCKDTTFSLVSRLLQGSAD